MQIASAFATIQPKELPYQELCFSCSEEVRSILFENPNNAGYVDTKDLPPSGVFSFSLASPLTLHYTPYSTSSFPFRLTASDLALVRSSTASTLLGLLRDSVWRRVSALDPATTQSPLSPSFPVASASSSRVVWTVRCSPAYSASCSRSTPARSAWSWPLLPSRRTWRRWRQRQVPGLLPRCPTATLPVPAVQHPHA